MTPLSSGALKQFSLRTCFAVCVRSVKFWCPVHHIREANMVQLRLWSHSAMHGARGSFTNVPRALQSNLAKLYNARIHIYDEYFTLTLCTCAQNMALGTCTKFRLEILIRSTISAKHKFRENIFERSGNDSGTTRRIIADSTVDITLTRLPWESHATQGCTIIADDTVNITLDFSGNITLRMVVLIVPGGTIDITQDFLGNLTQQEVYQ